MFTTKEIIKKKALYLQNVFINICVCSQNDVGRVRSLFITIEEVISGLSGGFGCFSQRYNTVSTFMSSSLI